MENKNFDEYSDTDLLEEKKKMKKSKIFHAITIGFLGGIFIFGTVSWILSPDKKAGFFIPMLIPVFFIYKLIKQPEAHNELKDVLKKRGLL